MLHRVRSPCKLTNRQNCLQSLIYSAGQVFRFQGAPDTKIEMDLQAPYKCAADQKNIIADATGQTHMSLSDVQIEAFRVNATTPEFTSGGGCHYKS